MKNFFKKNVFKKYYKWWSLRVCMVDFKGWTEHATKGLLEPGGLFMPLSAGAPQQLVPW